MEEDIAKIAPMILDRPNGRFDYLFCYVVQGEIDLVIENQHFSVREGCFILPPNTPHRYTNQVQKMPYEMYWVHFTGSQADEIVKRLGLNGKYNMSLGKMDEITSSIETIVREMTFKMPQYESIIESILLYTLAHVSRRNTANSTKKDAAAVDSRMQKAMEYICLYFRDSITVKQLADSSQLSVSRFSALFKQTFGLFPLQYILYYRIKRACELLKNTEYSITQIAELCGFDDPLYFSRVFKKEMNMCPSQYRSQVNSDVFKHSVLIGKNDIKNP